MKEMGFKSAYEEIHGEEPEWTFGTGLQSEFADPDPAEPFDYIFFKGDSLELTHADVAANKCVPGDPTLFASDHIAIVGDFKF